MVGRYLQSRERVSVIISGNEREQTAATRPCTCAGGCNRDFTRVYSVGFLVMGFCTDFDRG